MSWLPGRALAPTQYVTPSVSVLRAFHTCSDTPHCDRTSLLPPPALSFGQAKLEVLEHYSSGEVKEMTDYSGQERDLV